MPVKMQLARIIISELTENQVIYLQEVDGLAIEHFRNHERESYLQQDA